MSALLLRVEEGPRHGEEFRFDESDDVIVGREAEGSEAHLRLDPADRHVSRHQCVLEMRPPNCLVRDLGSKNGTEVRHQGQSKWRRVEDFEEISHGDAIRIGQTVLSLTLIAEPETPEPVQCIRCLEPIDVALSGDTFSVKAEDFMCRRCHAALAAERAKTRPARPEYRCSSCDADVADAADRDGRAEELAGVASYLCPECAEKIRELMRQDIGGYLLLSQLGMGGMGVVYRVWHLETGRVAALKQLLKPLRVPPWKIKRFMREIALLQRLVHPQVNRFFEAGEVDGVPYFVSEYLPQGDLSQFVSKDGEPHLTADAAARLVADALIGVGYAHEAGVVHRDLKPENVLLKQDGRTMIPKVADFGLSRSYEEHGGTITRPGEYGGTLHYLPPEQMKDFKGCRPPVDVYAMGVCLYYLLTGRYPLQLPAQWQLEHHKTSLLHEGLLVPQHKALAMVMRNQRIPIRDRRSDLPRKLAHAVDDAVQRDDERRIQSAEEFRARLLAAVGGAS